MIIIIFPVPKENCICQGNLWCYGKNKICSNISIWAFLLLSNVKLYRSKTWQLQLFKSHNLEKWLSEKTKGGSGFTIQVTAAVMWLLKMCSKSKQQKLKFFSWSLWCSPRFDLRSYSVCLVYISRVASLFVVLICYMTFVSGTNCAPYMWHILHFVNCF